MEKEPYSGKNKIEPEKTPEEATDSELAMFLIRHIDNPCGVEVEPGKKENIRHFYIKEAKKALSIITNPEVKNILELKIKEYENE